ncbi:GatB/YqeY domain-containing protein [Sulfurimonas sp.]|uniref:GatB/YqeY domain-containing protein n=1 Tax=Sulfurimonas sp. TaxID=2022749 RepID=UPI00262ACC86|nr:GatB/YqeY domain-containing protein [Sulfurimonas sp.]
MTLRETINQDVKEAMKAKDTKKRDALRLLTSAFKQIEVDERKELTDEDVIKIIQTQVKRRNDAASQYKEANREDLMQIELDEISYYETYLPKQLSDEELTNEVKALVEKSGATSMKEMGKVMGMASKALAGKADGKRISDAVKKALAS